MGVDPDFIVFWHGFTLTLQIPHTEKSICRGKIWKGSLLGSERKGKKDLACVCSFVKITEKDKAPRFQRQKRLTPAELQGHLCSATVAQLPVSTRCPLQIPSGCQWHSWWAATPSLPLGQWWQREERTRSIIASSQQGEGSCCTFCRVKAVLWEDDLFYLTKLYPERAREMPGIFHIPIQSHLQQGKSLASWEATSSAATQPHFLHSLAIHKLYQ